MTTKLPDTADSSPATGPLALKSNLVLGPNAQDVGRESVDDALLIVESYGPWGADLNDAHRRQIVLTEECKTLRAQLQTLGLWIAEALTTLDTVEPECSTEAELLTALIRRGEMLVLASLERGGALGPNVE